MTEIKTLIEKIVDCPKYYADKFFNNARKTETFDVFISNYVYEPKICSIQFTESLEYLARMESENDFIKINQAKIKEIILSNVDYILKNKRNGFAFRYIYLLAKCFIKSLTIYSKSEIITCAHGLFKEDIVYYSLIKERVSIPLSDNTNTISLFSSIISNEDLIPKDKKASEWLVKEICTEKTQLEMLKKVNRIITRKSKDLFIHFYAYNSPKSIFEKSNSTFSNYAVIIFYIIKCDFENSLSLINVSNVDNLIIYIKMLFLNISKNHKLFRHFYNFIRQVENKYFIDYIIDCKYFNSDMILILNEFSETFDIETSFEEIYNTESERDLIRKQKIYFQINKTKYEDIKNSINMDNKFNKYDIENNVHWITPEENPLYPYRDYKFDYVMGKVKEFKNDNIVDNWDIEKFILNYFEKHISTLIIEEQKNKFMPEYLGIWIKVLMENFDKIDPSIENVEYLVELINYYLAIPIDSIGASFDLNSIEKIMNKKYISVEKKSQIVKLLFRKFDSCLNIFEEMFTLENLERYKNPTNILINCQIYHLLNIVFSYSFAVQLNRYQISKITNMFKNTNASAYIFGFYGLYCTPIIKKNKFKKIFENFRSNKFIYLVEGHLSNNRRVVNNDFNEKMYELYKEIVLDELANDDLHGIICSNILSRYIYELNFDNSYIEYILNNNILIIDAYFLFQNVNNSNDTDKIFYKLTHFTDIVFEKVAIDVEIALRIAFCFNSFKSLQYVTKIIDYLHKVLEKVMIIPKIEIWKWNEIVKICLENISEYINDESLPGIEKLMMQIVVSDKEFSYSVEDIATIVLSIKGRDKKRYKSLLVEFSKSKYRYLFLGDFFDDIGLIE